MDNDIDIVNVNTIEWYQQQIAVHEENIAQYQLQLDTIQIELSRLADVTAQINQDAQSKRAELSSYGQGISSLLGFSAYRKKEASLLRSQLAREVARKKEGLQKIKIQLNEKKRAIKQSIMSEKQSIKELKTRIKEIQPSNKKSTTKSVQSSNIADSLAKLSNLYAKGILSENEFLLAKQKILQE